MSGHTPGPWVARSGTTRYAGQQERVNRITISTPPNDRGAVRLVATMEGPFADIQEAHANARIVAAAPALFTALKELVAANGVLKSVPQYRELVNKRAYDLLMELEGGK